MVAGNAQANSSHVGGIGRAVLEEPTGRPSESKASDAAAGDFADGLPVVLDSAVAEPASRSHGVIRKLKLAPPASAVGASATFTADTATLSPSGAQFDIPQPAEPPDARQAVPAPPARPVIPVGANGGEIVASRGASAPESTAPSTGHSTNPGADARRLATTDGVIIHETDQVDATVLSFQDEGEEIGLPELIGTSPFEAVDFGRMGASGKFFEFIAGLGEDMGDGGGAECRAAHEHVADAATTPLGMILFHEQDSALGNFGRTARSARFQFKSSRQKVHASTSGRWASLKRYSRRSSAWKTTTGPMCSLRMAAIRSRGRCGGWRLASVGQANERQ
jgi:hypothetical protein